MADPVTFEILRHRFLSITREGFITLRNVSGSPSVAQSNDCNIALLDRNGGAFNIGPGIQTHAHNCVAACKYVKENYSDNPGISSGDMFLSNDPYICTPHQTCAVVVAPFFHDGRLVAWTGAGIHLADVGGPTPGQVSLGAQSIWEEAMPVPPVKIVEGGNLRRDIEQVFLRPSRTPLQNSLDLRAKISANNVMQAQLREIVRGYGVETLEDVIHGLVETTEKRLRAALKEIPDGSWSETTYLDYFDGGRVNIYACKLTLTKKDEILTFDFSGSSEQAPGVVNVTLPALEANILRPVMGLFGYAIPPCPAGVFRVCRVIAEPGTFVNCTWPAGVCKGTTSGTSAVFQAVTSCLGQMMNAGNAQQRAITGFRPHMALFDFSGPDQHGQTFAGVFTDCALGTGGGAMGSRDGLDTGSGSEPEVSIPNVETNELRYPLLYLYRRHARDSGGAGKFRGGVGIELAFKPHGVKSIPNFILHSHGINGPNGAGQDGGYPHSCNEITVVRRSGVTRLLKAGTLPQTLDDLGGQRKAPPAFVHTYLNRDDVFHCVSSGGGGWGDPLERDSSLVIQDIEEGLVTEYWARESYGVALDAAGAIDLEQTAQHRETLRHRRRDRRLNPSDNSWPEYLAIWQNHSLNRPTSAGGACLRCGGVLREPLVWQISWEDAGPYYKALAFHKGFRLLAWSCPTCNALLLVKPFYDPGYANSGRNS